MIIETIAIIIGIMLAVAAVYYLIKDGSDKDSKTIYTTTLIIGLVIIIAAIIKISLLG